ncbi:hypothetical protein LWI29_032871 [Acer saccharum]|uniref:Uncharacterized protein n=1 Tax=Acer saccharum TaxID=4024 RepID=A0AA39VU10_ACESA|nr:hypothetical protein LWI29_032871 [Acer saccharum]
MSSSTDPRNADDDMMTEFETDNVSIQENVLRMMLMGKGLCHETGEEQLLFALLVVQDFDLRYMIAEIVSEKRSILSSATNSIIGGWKHLVDWFGSDGRFCP